MKMYFREGEVSEQVPKIEDVGIRNINPLSQSKTT